MKFLLIITTCSLCINLTLSIKNYRAAISNKDVDVTGFGQLIYEAAKSNADILVLPSIQNPVSESTIAGSDYYDEAIKTISSAAKEGSIYVVAHLYEKTRCQNREEMIRSNLVFDRQGAVVSVYRKPVNKISNCTSTSMDLTTFSTDFGVTFGVLMEEDIVVQSLEGLGSLKNFVVAGAWPSEIPFLSAQFSSPWAYITDANLITSSGIYAGKAGPIGSGTKAIVAELRNGELEKSSTPPVVHPTKLHGEDLSQYIIRPLDLEASLQGYKDTVCHGQFCCEFQVKTSFVGSIKSEVSYGLAAFDGVRHFGGRHNIGTQTCAMFACAGLYKRSCAIGSEKNNTNIHFEKLTVTGNFTRCHSAQFPVLLTADTAPSNFKFDRTTVKTSEKVTVEVTDSQNLLGFGIFGRDYRKDFEAEYVFGIQSNTEGVTSDFYEYFFNEDVQEFFDYVWIRLRILIFVVSIYILEML